LLLALPARGDKHTDVFFPVHISNLQCADTCVVTTIDSVELPRLLTNAASHSLRTGATMTIESRLAKLGVKLRAPGKPAGNYVTHVQTGNLLYLAGAGPGAKGKDRENTEHGERVA
jgi:hypothetical protein